MKHWPLAAAVLVLGGIALAIWLERPESPDESLFGVEMALPANLPPLAPPRGTLELAGTLRTAAGAPAAGAFVALLRADDDPAEVEPVQGATADDEGRFALRRLSPGAYRVVLTHPSAPPRTLVVELPFADGAGEVSWELAPPLQPLPVLPELRRGPLAGRLSLPETFPGDGAPSLEGFEVVIVPAPETPALSGACERRVRTDAAGAFALPDLVLASYQVLVLPPWAKGGSWPVLARVPCATSEGGTTVRLPLEVGALEGLVQEADGLPLAGALVRVSATDQRDAVGEPQLWPPAVSEPGGRFRVELLPPGRYALHLRAGAASRDVDVVVRTGEVAAVPLTTLDPRSGEGAGN